MLFTSYLKEDSSHLAGRSCLQFLNRLFKFNPALIANNLEIRKIVLALCKLFLAGLEQQILPISHRLCLGKLILELFNQKINSVSSEIDPTQICWDILGVENLEVRMFSLQFIPSLISLENPVTSFTEIVHYVPTKENSEVGSVGAAIVFGKLLISCPLLRVDAARSLFFVAADHPNLDTVENVLSEAAEHFGFSSYCAIAERYLDEVLDVWGKDYNNFPVFVCGSDDIENFVQRFVDKIAVQFFLNGDFDQISNLQSQFNLQTLKSRIFSKLYTSRLLVAENSMCIKMDTFLNYYYPDLSNFVSRNTSGIASNILSYMRGTELQASSGLLLALKSGLHQIGIKSNLTNHFKKFEFTVNTFEKSVDALEKLFGCKFQEIAKNTSAIKIQAIFLKYHSLINQYAKDPIVPQLFFNGYQLLLILSDSHLKNPFVFHPSLLFLCKNMNSGHLISAICIRLIRYTVKYSAQNQIDESIYYISPKLIALLDCGMDSALQAGDENLVEDIALCIEEILEIVMRHCVSVKDTMQFKASIAPLDPLVSRYSAIYKKYSVLQNDIASLSNWCFLNKSSAISLKPFERLSLILNDPEELQNVAKSGGKSLLQSFHAVISKSNRFSASVVEAYAKLLMIYSGGSFQESGHQFEKFADQESLPCYYGYVFTIEQLFHYLNSTDSNTYAICNKVLGSLCATAEGAQAVKMLDEYLCCYLSVYKGRKFILQSQVEPVEFEKSVLHNEALSEGEWLVELSKKLICGFEFPVFFQLLVPMIEESWSFAASMLPVLFHYILLCNHQNEERSNELLVSGFCELFVESRNKNSVRLYHILNTIKVRYV